MPTSTPGGSGSAASDPDLLTFDREMLTHDDGGGDPGGRLPAHLAVRPRWTGRRRGPDLPDRLPLRARGRGRRDHDRRPGGHAEPGVVGGLLLERPRPARGAGDRPDPQPAQAPAGELRAGPEPGPRVPGRGAGGRRAAARRPRAPPAGDHRGRRAAGRVGLVQGARRTCSRPTGSWTTPAPSRRRGKDLDALKEPLRPSFAQAMADVAADERPLPHRRDRVGVRHASRSPSPSGGPATRCAASRRWSTRAPRSDSGSSAPRRRPPPGTASAYARLLAARASGRRSGTTGPARLADRPGEARPRGLAVPHRRRAAGRRACGGRPGDRWTRTRRCATRPRSAELARGGGRGRRGAAAGGARRRAPRAGGVAAHRQAARRACPARHAAGADRHEEPARPPRPPRVRRRGRRGPAAALPDLPRGPRPAPLRSSTPRSLATGS